MGADSRELIDGRLKWTRDKYSYVGRAETEENHTDQKRSSISRKENYFADPRAVEYRRREINSHASSVQSRTRQTTSDGTLDTEIVACIAWRSSQSTREKRERVGERNKQWIKGKKNIAVGEE